MVKFLCDWQRVIHVDFFDRCQNSQCSLLLRPGKRRERKDPIQAEDRRKAGSLQYIARPHMAKTSMETSEIEMEPSDTSTVVPIWPLVISTCSKGSNQTCKACGLRTTTPLSRLFGCGYAANHKPVLKRASGCFQNFGKIVLTPEGSTLKTDMCK